MSRVDELRREAAVAMEKGHLTFRSCWNCNSMHEHLRSGLDDVVLHCFCCARFYFRGQNITEGETGEPQCGCYEKSQPHA